MAEIKGLYAIVDASGSNPVGMAKKILAGGCRIIQLRGKDVSSSQFLQLACEISNECRTCDALFIVNDRADIALASGAGGLHLGQDDLPLSVARNIMGEEKIIGISTHNIEEALIADKDGADYIGFGPIFKTKTKKDAQTPKGLEALKTIRKNISFSIVAIGGLKMLNVEELFNEGADAVAMISELSGSLNVSATTREIVELTRKNYEC